MHLIEPLEGCPVVHLPVEGKVKSVTALKDGSALKYRVENGGVSVTLKETPSDIDYVIAVELK